MNGAAALICCFLARSVFVGSELEAVAHAVRVTISYLRPSRAVPTAEGQRRGSFGLGGHRHQHLDYRLVVPVGCRPYY